jgi:hypothetical protein
MPTSRHAASAVIHSKILLYFNFHHLNLEEKKLIHIDEVDGKAYIKYNVEAVQIVRELQKTAYVHSIKEFMPPHH